jgi:hypothetical protein
MPGTVSGASKDASDTTFVRAAGIVFEPSKPMREKYHAKFRMENELGGLPFSSS